MPYEKRDAQLLHELEEVIANYEAEYCPRKED